MISNGTKVWFDVIGRDENNDSSAMISATVLSATPDCGGWTYLVEFSDGCDTIHSRDIHETGGYMHGGCVHIG